MTSVVRLSVVCTAMLSAGLSVASDDSEFGEFTTRVAEDRLFVENGRVLRCDLFFTASGRETVVAPKGSELDQSLPPVVWQYSGLLPVTDYLKTAVIHSASSELKEQSWQDVQLNFYDGLRVEGASELDAKIAYAGAYAFAPRWTLVELIQVDEPEPVYPGTVLYRVEYTEPAPASMEVEGYRDLSLQILQQPEELSLQAIRSVVDAADNMEAKSMERASLGGIGGVDTAGGGKLMGVDDVTIASASRNQSLTVTAEKAMESVQEVVEPDATVEPLVEAGAEVEIPVELVEPVELIETTETNEVFSPEQLPDGLVNEDSALETVAVASDTSNSAGIATEGGSLVLGSGGQVVKTGGDSIEDPNTEVDGFLPESDLLPVEFIELDYELPIEVIPSEVAGSEEVLDEKVMVKEVVAGEIADTDIVVEVAEDALLTAPVVTEGAADDEWIVLPDGTLVLRNVRRLVTN